MIEITFLGTSCMQPTKTRNQSGILLQYDQELILMDCGEGIQRQMRIAGIKPAKITRVLISHWHGDHVFGLPGILSTMGIDAQDQEKMLYIYGPKGTKKYLRHLVQSFAGKNVVPFEVKEIKKGIFYENEKFSLEAQPLKHSQICLGFSFHEASKRKIMEAKAQKLGVSGPLLGELQRGKVIVVNGKKIIPDEVSYILPGKKVSYIADTVPCEGANALAKDAYLVISEGTHLDDIKEKAGRYLHLTVKEAALIASGNNAKRLVITHLSQRYKEPSEVLAEAKMYFAHSIVAEDFMKIKV